MGYKIPRKVNHPKLRITKRMYICLPSYLNQIGDPDEEDREIAALKVTLFMFGKIDMEVLAIIETSGSQFVDSGWQN